MVNPNFTRLNAEDEEADPGSVLHFYRRMLALRKDPVYRETFVYGSFEPVGTEDKNLMLYVREADRKVLVAGNYQNREAAFELPGPALKVLLNNLEDTVLDGACVRMEPYQLLVLEI